MLSLQERFSQIEDPRVDRCKRHMLEDILVMAFCAIICNCKDYEEIEAYCQEKESFFKSFLSLPNGIPSHDTFTRLFKRLNPQHLQEVLTDFTKDIIQSLEGLHCCIDGKKIRGASPNSKGQDGLYIVSAWLAEQQLVLGQEKVDDKSNEKTAIPRLIAGLDLKGAIVTIDAMGSMKSVAAQIKAQLGEYILSIKGNNKVLQEQITAWLSSQRESKTSFTSSYDFGHGRIEKRTCYVCDDLRMIEAAEEWAGAKSIIIIEAEREIKGKTEKQTRYYISSLSASAQKFNDLIRSHWSIENQLHWMLDMVFEEDRSRVRTGHGAVNLNTMRKLALQKLTRMKDKHSIKNRTKIAGWNNQYLVKMLTEEKN